MTKSIKLQDIEELIHKENFISFGGYDLSKGRYISPIIDRKPFRGLIASWNVDTPRNTGIELLIKVRVEKEWSKWFTYGKWSSQGYRGSIANQEDGLAQLDIDMLKVLGGKEADALQYRVEILRDEMNPSPRVRHIYLALKTDKVEGESIMVNSKDYMVDLDVPERSQMVIPDIGGVICSPTSLSMVLSYYGFDIDTEEVAAYVMDKGADIYGNWSYNAAYGGTKCRYSYVAIFNSSQDIKNMISKGIPVIASIRTTSGDILDNAPQAYPSGHLVVIRGFKERDGQEYIIVNDPAALDTGTVRREYRLCEFERAWNKVVYILIK